LPANGRWDLIRCLKVNAYCTQIKSYCYPVQCSVSDVMVLCSSRTQNGNSTESSSMCCMVVRIKISG